MPLGIGRLRLLRQMAQGGFGRLRYIIQQFQFTGLRTQAIFRRFNLLNHAEALELLRLFRSLERGVVAQRRLTMGGRLRIREIPINQAFFIQHGLDGRIGYEVRISTINPLTQEVIDARTVFVESNTPLSNSVLQQLGTEQLLEMEGLSPTLDRFLEEMELSAISVEIVAVFRRF